MDDFEAWYRREYPRVLAACTALAGGRADAGREATDEAFTRAIERWRTVGAMAAPGGWVQVVALNHLRRTLRRHRSEQRAVRSHGPDPAAAPEPPDLALWDLVRTLPRRQQACVVLRYVHDLPEADIAEALGVARGTVASTLHSAARRLRSLLDEPVPAPEVPLNG
ncbi:MAG: RNA polymerase sigma factor [Acidimicrobiales bacterium]